MVRINPFKSEIARRKTITPLTISTNGSFFGGPAPLSLGFTSSAIENYFVLVVWLKNVGRSMKSVKSLWENFQPKYTVPITMPVIKRTIMATKKSFFGLTLFLIYLKYITHPGIFYQH